MIEFVGKSVSLQKKSLEKVWLNKKKSLEKV